MKTLSILIFATFILSAPMQSYAGTGNDLVKDCDADLLQRFDDMDLSHTERSRIMRCTTFVDGVMSGYDAGFHKGLTYATDRIMEANPKGKKKLETKLQKIAKESDEGLGFCEPAGVTRIQYATVVAKYLRDNPQELDQVATHLVLSALHDAFPPPCPIN